MKFYEYRFMWNLNKESHKFNDSNFFYIGQNPSYFCFIVLSLILEQKNEN